MADGNKETAASDLLAAVFTAREAARTLRPRVHPDDGDDPVACAIVSLCHEIRALTFAVLAASESETS